MTNARSIVRGYLNRRVQFGRNTLEAIFTRLLAARQVVEIVPGLRMALDLRKSNQRTLFWFHELAEPALQWTIRNLLPLGGTMVDCGANAGLMGLLALHYRSARVFFIEAHPRLQETVEANLRLNGFDDRATMLRWAASDAEGEAQFYLNETHDGLHSLAMQSGQSVTVRTRRLDTLFTEGLVERIDFLKIDTEGHDFTVLTGLGEHLTPTRVPRIYVETGAALTPIAALLQSCGYEGFSALRHTLDALPARRRAEAGGAQLRHFEPLGDRAKNVLWLPADSPEAKHLRKLASAASR
ncbi:MAG: FkbM family methyltransferase [Chthoniobacter sp.]|nr:FkbM family methyltransferase [Chthoniobacter sp.]